MKFDDLISIEPDSGRERLVASQVYVDDVLRCLQGRMETEAIIARYPRVKPEEIIACAYYNVVSPRTQSCKRIGEEPESALDVALRSLQSKATWMNSIGVVLFLTTAVFGFKLFERLWEATNVHVELFKDPAANNYPLLIFLLAKGAALTAIASGLLFFCVKLATACFDQAARFTKRRYGALFLKYLYSKFDSRDLNTPEGIEQIIKFFQAWNHNVESAFTHVKVEKARKGMTELTVGKDGATVKTDDRE